MKRFFVLSVLFIPLLLIYFIPFGFAEAQGIVPCGGEPPFTNAGECSICDLQVLAGNVLNFIIILGVILATLLFINAGFLYLTSSSNPGNISKGHKIFTNTLMGLIIVLAAWLIINAVMMGLYNSGTFGDWDDILQCTT